MMLVPGTNLTFLSSAALFALGAGVVAWHLRWMRRLPALEAVNDGAACSARGPVRCSVIVAARDEEARIEETIRRLLAQRGVQLELIVVDDRSRDRTPQILEQMSRKDARLKVLRIDQLPEGWLGKCHACHVGAGTATGEWILFTDADCWSKPDVLLRALRTAEHEQVDHVTLSSGLAVPSAGLRAGSLLFHLSVANWFSGVNRDAATAHLGFGAFNLVRAAAYRQCGGYEALRLTIVDDVKLGLLLRRAGKRTRAFLGAGDVEAHWGEGLWDTVKLMEKNYFAALEFRLPVAVGICAFITALIALVVLGAASGTSAGLAAALAPFFLSAPASVLARRMGWSPLIALGVPFALPVFLCALLNSTYVTVRQGGVRWRETFYSIEALRAGGVR